jgi:hypothetical protein
MSHEAVSSLMRPTTANRPMRTLENAFLTEVLTKGAAMLKGMRSRVHLAWWTGFTALGAAAAYAGTWRLWALTVLAWSTYELCFCPTTCGVTTQESGPCRNPARGRMFACLGVPGHQRLKTEALWRLTGRLSTLPRPRARARRAAHRKAPLTPAPAEVVYIQPNQRVLAYLAVTGVVVTTIEAAVGLAVQ